MPILPILSTKLKNTINKKKGVTNDKSPYEFTLRNIIINGVKKGCSGTITNRKSKICVYINTEGTYTKKLLYRYHPNGMNLFSPNLNEFANDIIDILDNSETRVELNFSEADIAEFVRNHEDVINKYGTKDEKSLLTYCRDIDKKGDGIKETYYDIECKNTSVSGVYAIISNIFSYMTGEKFLYTYEIDKETEDFIEYITCPIITPEIETLIKNNKFEQKSICFIRKK